MTELVKKEINEVNQESKQLFPIRELSARTQVSTVTLRAWERRYGLLTPQRTTKGHRLYSEKDVVKIERILNFVTRGVAISKVKALLQGSGIMARPVYQTKEWQESVAEFMAAVESFSTTKVSQLIHKLFANYPASICRDRLMEPVFVKLVLSKNSSATFGFAESELIRYVLMRLSAKIAKNTHSDSVILMVGAQTPIWPLALMALELSDAIFSVHLLTRELTLTAGVEFARKSKHAYTVFYQDGIWKNKDQEMATTELLNNDRFFLCGTAPAITQLASKERVFADVKCCTDNLLQLQKNID